MKDKKKYVWGTYFPTIIPHDGDGVLVDVLRGLYGTKAAAAASIIGQESYMGLKPYIKRMEVR